MKFLHYIKKHTIFFSIIVLLLLAVSYGSKVKSGKAIVPFGGVITAVTPCDCSVGYMIIVAGPTTAGAFLYQTGVSILFPWYEIFTPGPFVLGTYIPGAVCMIGVPPACTDAFMGAGAEPYNGTIEMVGSSL